MATHPLTGAWRLAWSQVNTVKYSGPMVASLVNVSPVLPMRLATINNMRQSIDMQRGTWVDALDVSTENFKGVWTVHGFIDDTPVALPIRLHVTFGTGYLTGISGTPPLWLDEYVDTEFALSGIGKATTISMGPCFRIDRDSQGRLAMLTKVKKTDQSKDLFHTVSPEFTRKFVGM